MKKILIRVICLMAFCLFTACLMTPSVHAATKSGTDGDIVWKISGDTLVLDAVEGSQGVMDTYYFGKVAPWQNEKAMKSVKKVIIKDGIKQLGPLAFYGDNLHFESMQIAGSVESIPDFFCHSIAIDNLYLCEGTKIIGKNAFLSVVKNIYVPKSVEIMPISAFGTYNSTANGTVSYVEKVYGYTDTTAKTYVENYLEAVEASGKSFHIWSDGKSYSFDYNQDGVDDDKPSLSFVALNQPDIFSKSKVTKSLAVTVNKSGKIRVTVPSYLKLVKSFAGVEGQVKVTYKSGNTKVVAVDKTGKVTGKKKGTVKVTTTLQLENGTKKKFTTTVTVK